MQNFKLKFLAVTILQRVEFPISYWFLHGHYNSAARLRCLWSDLRFAEDIALLAEKETGLQELITDVAETSAEMGMCINTAKTETQVLGKGGNKFQIQVYGQQLTQVDKFVRIPGWKH